VAEHGLQEALGGRPVGDDQDTGTLTKIDEYVRGLAVLEMPTTPAGTTAIAS